MNKSMLDFITTVKNSKPSTHWKDFSKSKEVTILKKEILVVQKKINPGNSSAPRGQPRCSLNAQLRGLQHAPCFASAIED
jgi:hypothetical protein